MTPGSRRRRAPRRAARPPPPRSCRCRRRARPRGEGLPRSPRPSPATCRAMPAVNKVNPWSGPSIGRARPASPTRYSSSSPPSRSATASIASTTASLGRVAAHERGRRERHRQTRRLAPPVPMGQPRQRGRLLEQTLGLAGARHAERRAIHHRPVPRAHLGAAPFEDRLGHPRAAPRTSGSPRPADRSRAKRRAARARRTDPARRRARPTTSTGFAPSRCRRSTSRAASPSTAARTRATDPGSRNGAGTRTGRPAHRPPPGPGCCRSPVPAGRSLREHIRRSRQPGVW